MCENELMSRLRHSKLPDLLAPNSFLWATGIEDTFITAPWPATGRTLDEYELTQHYTRWREDIGLMREIGVPAARYGIPWHRIQPSRNEWNWDFVDRAVDRLLECGVEPIIDLVHYGLPSWIEGAYFHPDYPRYVSEYAAKVTERLKGRVYAYTPLNEPRITAWYCGRLGWWPPHARGWRGFVAVMLGVCRGIVETVRAIRAVEPDALIAHVDATDLYESAEAAFQLLAEERQEIVFLALDLVSGRVREGTMLNAWLRRHGASGTDIEWFQENHVDLPLVGLNLYPMFTQKVLKTRQSGEKRWVMPYADASIIERLGELYWARYGAPLFISETASVGTVARRQAWLKDSVVAVHRARVSGVPLIGYTWWPLFALVTWGYRQGTHPPEFYLKQMGLWDLDSRLDRVSTPLVREFARLTGGGAESVGNLRAEAFPGGDRE
jgi:beta-glucosidase